ncbi:recombinase family protein [Chloroflexota bacterium]
MKAIAIIRCSSKPQLDKYGPASQLNEIKQADFPKGTIEIVRKTELQESASGWNRKKWEEIMNDCLSSYRQGEIQVVIFPRVDRETRFLAGSFPKLLDLIKAGIIIFFAREGILLDCDPANRDSFESYQREALDAQAYIRVFRSNTMRGKRACAEAGGIPSGFGRYGGYFGLRYDKKGKTLIRVPSQIEVAAEILNRAIDYGQSSSEITRDLQAKGVKGASGGNIHRSSVSRVLANAKVYAGIIEWDGIRIEGKVEPIITDAQADRIAARLRLNKERSQGFGKRKWLTGRVFCGVCNRRYNLDSRKGCYCNGADNRNPIRCKSPKVGLLELSALAYGTMIMALSEPETIIQKAKETHNRWQEKRDLLQELNRRCKSHEYELEKRRRLLSFQHENGGLTDQEYRDRLEQIKREYEMAPLLDPFQLEPEPPSLEQVKDTFNRLAHYAQLRQRFGQVLKDPQDKEADKLAQEIDMKVIISPTKIEGQKYSAQVLMNLPIADSEIPFPNEKEPIAMVFQSTSGCVRLQRLPRWRA